MSRTRDRLAGLEETARGIAAAAARIEAKLDRTLAEAKGARSSADAAHAGVQALADMLPAANPDPDRDNHRPAVTAPAAPGTGHPAAAGGGTTGERAARRAAEPERKRT